MRSFRVEALLLSAAILLCFWPAREAAAGETDDGLECFAVHEAPAPGPRWREIGNLDGCRLRAVASLLCVPTSPAPGQARDETAAGLLCYRLRCPQADAGETTIEDTFGYRRVTRGEAVHLCTPAELGGNTNAFASRTGRSGASGPGSAGADFQLATCGDFSGNATITSSDAQGALRAAVGSASCLPCVCDVDQSKSTTAGDALKILRKAVGQNVTLDCLPDGNPVSWTGAADNQSWHMAGNWSLATRVPNLCDDVTIASAGPAIRISQGSNAAMRVHSVREFDVDNGTLQTRDTVFTGGALRFAGGTLQDSIVVASDDAALETESSSGFPRAAAGGVVMTSNGGVMDHLTVEADVDATATKATVRVHNGLELNGVLTMGSQSTLRFQGGEQTLSGTGEVLFQSTGAKSVVVDVDTTLTIAEGMTIRGATGTVGSAGAIVNNGLIDSESSALIRVTSTSGLTNNATIRGRSGGGLELDGVWTNQGTISIADGGELSLEGTWTNAGMIDSVDSTVNLGGTFSLASLGDFGRTGGSVNITGTFHDANGLLLDATTGSWLLAGGTILGGSVTAQDGGALVASGSGGLLDGVTLESGIDATAMGANFRVQNSLVLNGPLAMGPSSNMRFQGGQQTLSGSGDVFFQGTGTKTIVVDSGTTLTIAEGMTVHGAAGTVGSAGAIVNDGLIDSEVAGLIRVTSTAGLTNHAIIRARAGGDLRLDGAWTNAGTISVADGGELSLEGTWTNAGMIDSTDSIVNLGGSFSLASLGDFDRTGGSVNITGTFNNTTGLVLGATTGSWRLDGGTILGGTVTEQDGAVLEATNGNGILSGVTLATGMDATAQGATFRIQNSLVLNGPLVMGPAADVRFQGGEQTLSGSGEIYFQGSNAKNILVDNGTSLTIAPGMTIRGGAGTVGSTGIVVNKGTIDSDESGDITIKSSQDGWDNQGTMIASGGGLRTGGVGANTTGTITIGQGRTLTALNGFAQQGGATLALEIGGASSFGKVAVTGAAALAGTLSISLAGGYDPALGTQFQIMTYGSRSGDFTVVNGLAIGGGKKLQRTTTATTMTLEVVAQ